MPVNHRRPVRQAGLALIAVMLCAGGGVAGAPAVPSVVPAPASIRGLPAVGAAVTGWAAGTRFLQSFSVNAQARTAAGHKNFPNVGAGKVTYVSIDPARFAIQIQCLIENPDNHQKYSIDLDMEYRVEGDRVVLVSRHNRYNKNAESYSRNIERAVPFIYLAKYLNPPAANRDPTRTFFFEGTEYTLRYVQTEREMEATLYTSDGAVGKFFIDSGQTAAPLGFQKFRVPQGDVVLSFVFAH